MFALSLGIPLGLIIALVGVVLLLAKQKKILATGVIGLGLIITLATIFLIILAANTM